MIVIPNCTLVVAPADGRARHLVEPGATVERGQVVAEVGGVPLHAPARGTVGGHLAAGAVARGEGILWLSR